MLALPLAIAVAIVTQDATPLRAAARETATKQALLWQGDWLEVRGERQGYLQVYDHRRERPGYVLPQRVRTYAVEDVNAPVPAPAVGAARDLAAVIDFLRDQPGQEALGIGYVALFLRAAPASAVGPEVFDALGVMAERLARRASSKWARPDDAALAGQLEVAESYGVKWKSFERDGRTRVCYDGEAFRRSLAVATAPVLVKVRAALALTDPACVDPALAAADREPLATWQAEVLDHADPSAATINQSPLWLLGRLRLRRAQVNAQLAYLRARRGAWKDAQRAGEAAVRELALVDKNELGDDDVRAYQETAVAVAAVRWAEEPDAPLVQRGLKVAFSTGQPGETCIEVRTQSGKQPLVAHCTYGLVWPGSLRVSPHGDAVAIAVSPLPGWAELHLLHKTTDGWKADTLAPAATQPDLGYVELAGFSPDGARVLLAREARMTGPPDQPGTLAPWVQRSFQVVNASSLLVEKQASTLERFPTFRRWQSTEWRRSTLALR